MTNMAVPQMVNLFEALERPRTPPQDRGRLPSRIRLQLQTMFNHTRSRQSSPRSTPSSSNQSSPSPSYRSYNRRTHTLSSDPSSLYCPQSVSSSSSPTRSHARRQQSAIDVALEAERRAVGAENIGLDLLEPRPRALSSGSQASSQCSIMEFMNESQPTPAVLDGIIEVMEGA